MIRIALLLAFALMNASTVRAQNAPANRQSPDREQADDGAESPDPAQGGVAGEAARRPPPVCWRAELPGGTFAVELGAIQSISSHEYVLNGTARVIEVNVATAGSTRARFYYIGPLRPILPAGVESTADAIEKRAAEAATSPPPGLKGDPPWAKVGKTYPETTHAGSVEYRLDSLQQLDDLFQSLDAAWSGGRAAVFRVGHDANATSSPGEESPPDPTQSPAAKSAPSLR